jgi:PAS domain S-box-containing protein
MVRLAEAFSSSESIVALLNAVDGRFLDVNAAFERISGYPRDQVIGRIPLEIGLWRDPEFRAQLWESLRTERRIVDVPTTLECADGSTVHGRLHVEYLHEDGQLLLFCLLQVLPDDHAQRVADRREGLYRALYLSAAEGIYRSLPGGGFLDANPALAQILGYESPAQMLLALGNDAKQIYADPGDAEELYRRLAADGHLEQYRIRVRRRDGGVVWVRENTRVITDEAGHASFYEGSLEDITAQVEAERALVQSQALYRVLLDNSRDGVFLIQRGKVKFANEAMSRMLGYPFDELVGLDYMRLVAPENQAEQLQRKQARESGSRDQQLYEMVLVRKDGTRLLAEVRADAVDYQGDIASTGTMRDVTEERAHQQALEQAERRYRELFEDSPAGLFRTALDGTILEVNAVMARLLGYASVAELRAEVTHMTAVYADLALREELVARALSDGSFNQYEMQIVTRGGGRRWVSASVRVDRDADGTPVSFTGSALDIDHKHEMEQALARSENKYRTLVEQSHVGVFIMGDGRYVYVNRALADMVGRDEAQMLGLHYKALLAPEVLKSADSHRDDYMQTGHLQHEYESCFMHASGQRVYVRVSISPVDIDGRQHMTGTILDITRQREAESRLRFHATHDPLTGLPNRTLFNRRLAERLGEEAERRGQANFAVLFLDLDGFK